MYTDVHFLYVDMKISQVDTCLTVKIQSVKLRTSQNNGCCEGKRTRRLTTHSHDYTFSITCTLSARVTVGVSVYTNGVAHITGLGTCTVSRWTRVELQVRARNTGSEHSPVTILNEEEQCRKAWIQVKQPLYKREYSVLMYDSRKVEDRSTCWHVNMFY